MTWNLETWLNIINEDRAPVQVSYESLNQNMHVIQSLISLATELETKSDISVQTKRNSINRVLSSLLDILTASKMFEINLPEKAGNWKLAMRQEFHLSFDENLASLCHANFLYLEASLFGKQFGCKLGKNW